MNADAIKQALPVALFTYGAYLTLRSSLSFTYAIYRNWFRQPFNFQKRYGKDTWALVTGAGAGIGYAFAEQLAKRGMNVIMLGRGNNVVEAAEALQKKYPQVKIHPIIFDLLEMQNNSQWLIEQLGDREISMLVNNAGVGQAQALHLFPLNMIYDTVNVNLVSLVHLTHIIVNRMVQRGQRSAVINISSLAGSASVGYLATYSATKHFVNAFTNAIAYEYQDKIDILNVCPLSVSTKIIGSPEVQGFTVSADDCAINSLRQLGAVKETRGAWRHNLQFSLIKGWYGIDGITKQYTSAFKSFID